MLSVHDLNMVVIVKLFDLNMDGVFERLIKIIYQSRSLSTRSFWIIHNRKPRISALRVLRMYKNATFASDRDLSSSFYYETKKAVIERFTLACFNSKPLRGKQTSRLVFTHAQYKQCPDSGLPFMDYPRASLSFV